MLAPFTLKEVLAAPVADLDVEQDYPLCAVCRGDATYLLCGLWPARPLSVSSTEPPRPSFLTQTHAELGTNFDFYACEHHVGGWGRPGSVKRPVSLSASSQGIATLIFTKLICD